MSGASDDRPADRDGGSHGDDRGPVEGDRGPGTREGELVAGLDRRTLIRLLVGLGIGIPVLIEGATLLGLLGGLFGDGGEATATPTRTATGVGVGDELLPETAPAETVESAYITADAWLFSMTVGVENTGDRTYQLRLEAVRTRGGDVVEGGGESGPIEPGASGSVTGTWDLPDGAAPDTVDVVAIARDGTATKVERAVTLGVVPVQGG